MCASQQLMDRFDMQSTSVRVPHALTGAAWTACLRIAVGATWDSRVTIATPTLTNVLRRRASTTASVQTGSGRFTVTVRAQSNLGCYALPTFQYSLIHHNLVN